MEKFFTIESLGSLLMLTVMEIVLGIDNIIFISIVSGRLPHEEQRKARTIGLGLALLVRISLLFAITWIMSLTRPLFSIGIHEMTAHHLILLTGGLFLVAKSISEIHGKLEGHDENRKGKAISLRAAIIQIVLLDIVFSFDSILTAIGIAEHVEIMIGAVIISMGVMLMFAKGVSNFVNRHPSIKMLALSFLLMIGFLLVMEGLPETVTKNVHIPKGYLYFAMAFSFAVEMLNIQVRKKSKPVKLHNQPDLPELPDNEQMLKP